MTFEERVDGAWRSAHPALALRALVGELAREGHAKPAIVEMLEVFVVRQRAQPDFRDGEEDSLLDVLDALQGWCHASGELLPDRPVR